MQEGFFSDWSPLEGGKNKPKLSPFPEKKQNDINLHHQFQASQKNCLYSKIVCRENDTKSFCSPETVCFRVPNWWTISAPVQLSGSQLGFNRLHTQTQLRIGNVPEHQAVVDGIKSSDANEVKWRWCKKNSEWYWSSKTAQPGIDN